MTPSNARTKKTRKRESNAKTFGRRRKPSRLVISFCRLDWRMCAVSSDCKVFRRIIFLKKKNVAINKIPLFDSELGSSQSIRIHNKTKERESALAHFAQLKTNVINARNCLPPKERKGNIYPNNKKQQLINLCVANQKYI